MDTKRVYITIDVPFYELILICIGAFLAVTLRYRAGPIGKL